MYEILRKAAANIGKKPSTYGRELMEQKMGEISLITDKLKS